MNEAAGDHPALDKQVAPPDEGECYIGLMSGTSLDGVDGVLSLVCAGRWQTLAHAHQPFPAPLRQALLDLNTSGPDELHRAAIAAQALAVIYAEVVQAVCQQARIQPSQVRAIGAHGQTVRHRPELGYTLQLNQPSLLAELAGIDVVADFRSRDVAAAGQGAPLVPAFHDAIFSRPDRTVVVLNIGGMANLSILRPGQGPLGFDCGPGNALLDMWCHQQTGQPFDANGEWGAGGQVREEWLVEALAEPFFALPPPKSTGRDLFNADWLRRWLEPHGVAVAPSVDQSPEPGKAHVPARAITGAMQDVQATLCELTARSAAQAVQAHAGDASELIVCGGGALNTDLMKRLARLLPGVSVCRSDERGLAVMQVEAAAFAWLAWAHVHRVPGNLPAVTGARGPRVLGALFPA